MEDPHAQEYLLKDKKMTEAMNDLKQIAQLLPAAAVPSTKKTRITSPFYLPLPPFILDLIEYQKYLSFKQHKLYRRNYGHCLILKIRWGKGDDPI